MSVPICQEGWPIFVSMFIFFMVLYNVCCCNLILHKLGCRVHTSPGLKNNSNRPFLLPFSFFCFKGKTRFNYGSTKSNALHALVQFKPLTTLIHLIAYLNASLSEKNMRTVLSVNWVRDNLNHMCPSTVLLDPIAPCLSYSLKLLWEDHFASGSLLQLKARCLIAVRVCPISCH